MLRGYDLSSTGDKSKMLLSNHSILTLFSTHSIITLGYFLLNQRKNAGTPILL